MRSAKLAQLVAAISIALAVSAATLFAQQKAAVEAPTVDRIIDRFIAASGGRAAIEKFTSRASLGTIEIPAMNLTGAVMIHEKAPNKTMQAVIISGNVFRQAFDGKTAWSDDPADGTRVLNGVELAEARRDADFFHSLHLHEIYSSISYAGTDTIGDRRVYVLTGITPDEPSPDKMYFDAEKGLVLRVVSHRHTADGEADLRVDFDDYRDVDGIQLPFTIRQSGGSSEFTIHITQVRNGADLDDSEFEPPETGKAGVQ